MSFTTEDPVVFYGRKVTPSMCPMKFVVDSKKCENCGKARTATITYKNGEYTCKIKCHNCSNN